MATEVTVTERRDGGLWRLGVGGPKGRVDSAALPRGGGAGGGVAVVGRVGDNASSSDPLGHETHALRVRLGGFTLGEGRQLLPGSRLTVLVRNIVSVAVDSRNAHGDIGEGRVGGDPAGREIVWRLDARSEQVPNPRVLRRRASPLTWPVLALTDNGRAVLLNGSGGGGVERGLHKRPQLAPVHRSRPARRCSAGDGGH